MILAENRITDRRTGIRDRMISVYFLDDDNDEEWRWRRIWLFTLVASSFETN